MHQIETRQKPTEVDKLAEELLMNMSPEKTFTAREDTETPLMKIEQQVDNDEPIKVQNNSPSHSKFMQIEDNDMLGESNDLGF